MKNSYLLIALLSNLFTFSFGQNVTEENQKDWQAVAVAQHQKGKWLVGIGPTFLGGTAKAGRFVANRTWLGVQSEVHYLLSTRVETGVFARYYLWNGGVFSGFSEAGVSYGRFQAWNLNTDGPQITPPVYWTPKVNMALGIEIPIGRWVSLEGVAKAGRLIATNWVQPSFQGSINVYLGR